jgi:G:T/U-mismatch repair DNA glycosylase
MTTININNFSDFLAEHSGIKMVFFNGGMAEKLYKSHVLPSIQGHFTGMTYLRVPSTSPAYAAMTLAQKIEAWKAILPIMAK